MADNDDDIPILTDAIERAAPKTAAAGAALEQLHAEICAASLARAEELLRDAVREAEHVLIERTMHALRAEIPELVRGILAEHFEK